MTVAGRKRKLFELEEARSTLPLVSRIVSDIVEITATMGEVYLEVRQAAGRRETAARLKNLFDNADRIRQAADLPDRETP